MPAAPSRSPAGVGPAAEASSYLASETHYLFVAGRILAALRGAARLVVVTGERRAEPRPLSEALEKLAGPRQRVIGIACAPDLAAEALGCAGAVVERPAAESGTVAAPGAAEIGSAVLVFEEADRLSDRQIEEICTTTGRRARHDAGGVLLASQEFLARLDRPPLQPLKGGFVGLRFDEIGDDEAIDFLRHQLAARQSHEEESRVSPLLRRGIAALGALAAVVIGASLAVHYMRTPDGQATAEHPAPPGYAAPAPAPLAAPAPPATPERSKPTVAAPQMPSPPPQPQNLRNPDATAAPSAPREAAAPPEPPRGAQPSFGQRLSAEEIGGLVARGDKFLSAGDIASARSFYERAADAGSGAAALRLGATFDPNFLGRAGVLGSPGDPGQAAAWYRRARDLGDAAAAERLRALNPR